MACLNRAPPDPNGILCSVKPIRIRWQSVSLISYCTYLVTAHNIVQLSVR